jgi:hypothetical protein
MTMHGDDQTASLSLVPCRFRRFFRTPALIGTAMAMAVLASVVAPSARGDQAAVASARKELAAATTQKSKADLAVKAAEAKVLEGFKKSPEWSTAQQQIDAAKATYDAAAKPVLEKVRSSPEYQKAATARQNAADQLAALRNSPNVTAEALTRYGNEQYANDQLMKKMEADALASDPQIAQAKEKLTIATKSQEDLKRKLEELEQADPDYIAAKKDADEANDKLAKARTAMQEAAKADAESRRGSRPSPTPRRTSTRGGG